MAQVDRTFSNSATKEVRPAAYADRLCPISYSELHSTPDSFDRACKRPWVGIATSLAHAINENAFLFACSLLLLRVEPTAGVRGHCRTGQVAHVV